MAALPQRPEVVPTAIYGMSGTHALPQSCAIRECFRDVQKLVDDSGNVFAVCKPVVHDSWIRFAEYKIGVTQD